MGRQVSMLAAFAYYFFVIPLSYLPLVVLYRLSDFAGFVFCYLIPYRKKVIEANIQRSFPELSPVAVKMLRNQFYRHFADLLVEGIKNLTISAEELKKRYIVENPEIMEQLYNKGQSVLLVGGHYTNWEWLISIQQSLFPHQSVGIGTPLSSKFWDKKVNQRRQRYGMHVVHAKNYKEAFADYKKKKQPIAVLTLSDQSPADSNRSYWTNFLNQPTAVLFGAELMANEHDMAVVFFSTKKVKRGYYSMHLELLTDAPRTLPWGKLTEMHTQKLEKIIQHEPAFWLWSHKRWKRQIPTDLTKLKNEQREKFDAKYR